MRIGLKRSESLKLDSNCLLLLELKAHSTITAVHFVNVVATTISTTTSIARHYQPNPSSTSWSLSLKSWSGIQEFCLFLFVGCLNLQPLYPLFRYYFHLFWMYASLDNVADGDDCGNIDGDINCLEFNDNDRNENNNALNDGKCW